MNDEQVWMQRLGAFLDHVQDTANATDPAGLIGNLRSVVNRWIPYALGQQARPDERNEPLLTEWVTRVLDLQIKPQGDYRSRVRRWWRWCEGSSAVTELPNCWVVRAGREGEAVEHNLRNDVVTIAWAGWGDWSGVEGCESRDALRDFIDERFGDLSENDRQSALTQIWAFGGRIKAGDLVVMPMKGTDGNPIAVGRVDGSFEYDRSQPDHLQKRRRVTWLRTGIERDVIRQDLLYSMDSSGTVFGLRTRDAAYRVRYIAEHGVDPGPQDAEAPADQDQSVPLAQLVAEFSATGYPSDDDHQHELARAEFEQILRSLPETAHDEREAVKAVWNPAEFDYGSVGYAGAGANRLVNKASEQDWPLIRSELAELCLGSDDEATRLDRAAASGVLSGVRYVVGTRLLAICQPHDVIPIYLLRKSRKYPGVIDMIEVLNRLDLIGEDDQLRVQELLSLPDAELNSGAAVMRANDLLLDTLRPHFSDDGDVDTWGMSKFLYWVMERQPNDDETDDPWIDESDLAALAEDLLSDVGFVKEVVSLLEDKGQVILYGPPGTGKTYFARQLAWTLLGIADDEYYEDNPPYSLVQFHPAYSYEDFFEGFRPQVDDGGQMTYELTPGPLVRLAERAADHPAELHVMVIDEINRANLPRVLGELLYLLEYRDDWVQTQYRPDDGFELPPNLWIIGTMNTADRSIALIDAAMRRRFHFVPFFPNRPPTRGLLQAWTDRYAPSQDWIPKLLDRVNSELEQVLDGDHLLIGPSHFMKPNLDEDSVRRIWTYNVEPLIEDQLFGQRDAIERFRFQNVMQRCGPDADAEHGVHVGADDPTSAVDGAAGGEGAVANGTEVPVGDDVNG